MSATNMINHTVRLKCQPDGIMPELHLKEDTKSASLSLIVPPGGVLKGAERKSCVIMATLPDGSELFFTEFTESYRGEVLAQINRVGVGRMSAVAGKYKCTLTILNTSKSVGRGTYKDYDFLTVLPFTVIVHKRV